ncbi:hypothetical protein [Microbacterium testaceum]|uniref:hypothetical protein n=1 Tax=Microbacterium testaceum TaxID=2033 RepID=UPI0012AD1447|nr:hypothetical protein [Microbacterium testaceum]
MKEVDGDLDEDRGAEEEVGRDDTLPVIARVSRSADGRRGSAEALAHRRTLFGRRVPERSSCCRGPIDHVDQELTSVCLCHVDCSWRRGGWMVGRPTGFAAAYAAASPGVNGWTYRARDLLAGDMGMTNAEVKRIVLPTVPLSALTVVAFVLAVNGLWVLAVIVIAVAVAYLIWSVRRERNRDADEALARAARYEAAERDQDPVS